ncbi:DNA topoisomerase 3 [Petrocella atlantisensis]|uniref:DNA topoisomerase n=1 Tax=Petrocella atlantisensis TaxID=2173034 RepID=A0A3P7Q1L8_9FIRM|nr:DNA topoisomerase 3 [Petrocella atlantisensis]VDN49231.1 DNA topoisomerase 3 [Petrocella atlantisensis]
MKLVIAEKPSVAISIAKVLGARDKKQGYITGNGYIVSWCVGHLVSLSKPEEYDERFAKWNKSDLPILPDEWKLSVKEGTKQQYRVLTKLIASDEVTSLVEATDAGREGELIFRLVYDHSKCSKPYQRLWISSMEDSAIKEGFNQLQDGTTYENLYQSAIARTKADWLVGLNATRLFTTTYHTKLSVGRVQTPTLAMIVERDEKINNFKKEKFYHVELDLGDFKLRSEKIKTIDEAKVIAHSCQGKSVVISELTKELKKNKPPALFDLTSLQRETNRMFGYTAKQTLDYTQSLYEKKLVTYPRTDSRFITEDMKDSVVNLLPIADNPAAYDVNRIINNKKVSDHHAIIPTKQSLKLEELKIPNSELNVLKLIQTKLLIAVCLEHVYEAVNVKADVDGMTFTATTKVIVEMGFKKIEQDFRKEMGLKVDEDKNNNSRLTKINEGDTFKIIGIENIEGTTSPPKRFTEDTLLSAMERAGIEELDDSLETEKQGLGTPATRAAIIEKLISTLYVERKKKNLIATSKGVELIRIVPDKLKSAQITAQWENKLTEISDGIRSADDFLEEIRNEVIDLVDNLEVQGNPDSFKIEKEVIGKCPRCGTDIYEGNKNFYCSNRDCKFSMWKEDKFFTNKKKKLTKSIAKALLSKGNTKVNKLYSDKKDTYYDAKVVLNDTGVWVNYKLEFK